MRERLVSRVLNPKLRPLPSKFELFPEFQRQAIGDVVEHFDAGAKVVVVDAPTGSGKTVIAEAVRLMLGVDAAFVCHSKTLQDQFTREFAYSNVLYGKANYTPIHPTIMDATCEDCTRDCAMCPTKAACPYQLAKMAAIRAPVAVVNSALWLSAMQVGGHWLGRRGLTIFDEADTLENVLMSQAEIVISPRMQTRYKITPPTLMTKDYGDWAKDTLERLRRVKVRGSDIRAEREKRRLKTLTSNVELLLLEELEGKPWVYTGGAGSERRTGEYISFKPVTVNSLGVTRIWRHSPRFLLMSGTVVSSGMMLRGLGYHQDYSAVSVPSQFPPQNRPVIVRPVQDMTKKSQDSGGISQLCSAIERILNESHPTGRVLIHTVSYRLAQSLQTFLLGCSTRPVFSYAQSSTRAAALDSFLATPNAVLVAASLDRGVDLYDDRCRCQIICKVPFPSLGDRQVSARLHNTQDGKIWYNVEVARTIQQMVGRGVRHANDSCTTYVLDSHFLKWRRSWGHLFPEWFARAIRVEP